MSHLRPLPGISFETRAEPLGDALPRMDIPAFVGFAASGPVDVPVAVEDVAQFAMIFGGDVELPGPRGASEARVAHLGPSVRAFFRNGGRRCWIVRVAGASATSNRFAIPGLFTVAPTGEIAQAYGLARAQGSWSDALRVEASLASHALALRSYDHAAGTADVAVSSPREVVRGDLVRLTWLGSSASLYVFVTSIVGAAGSPPSGAAGVVRLAGMTLWVARTDGSPPGVGPSWAVTTAPATAPAGGVTAERLAFDLTVRPENDQRERPLSLANLGFTPEHPRYAGGLPTDARLFEDPLQFTAGAAPRYRPAKRISFTANFTGATEAPLDGWPELWAEAAQPRFPLAAPAIDGSLYVPAGMSAFPSGAAVAETTSAPTLERDGLAGFDAALFLDATLADTRMGDLLDRADALRYKAGRALKGVHAVLGIEEVTMLAAPDAVHRGWSPDSAGSIASPLASSPLAHPEQWRWLDCHEPLPAGLPEHNAGFVACDVRDPVAAPLLVATPPQGGTYSLSWDLAGDSSVEVQEARRPDFSDAATIALDATAGALMIYGRAAGDYFYRARRMRGARTSDWSAGIGVRVASLSGWVALEDDGSEIPALASIHLGMLRMCAARADLVALLSLARDYDERGAIAHVVKLSALAEPGALGYGALWHPWVTGREDGAQVTSALPADGLTAGVMAARASTRGAWVAPANEPLRGVVGLTPIILPGARQALQDAAINLIRQEPAGFVCLDADTLSAEADIRALNVRRLLILVRRAALRTGNDYAFEPNGTSLRNTIKRGFEAMLAILFQRGAFAGRTAKSAYQVLTDETVNTRQSVDAGRLIAEIRIAPSRPLSFLTIRLVQRGEAAVAQEIR